MKTAVVLAAGRGSRMGALTARTPKPLLDVGGRPILERVLAGFAAAGIERVVLVTGHLGDRIEAAFGGGVRFGLDITCCRQAEPRGTADALLLAEAEIGSEPFLLSWGDILVDPEFYADFAAAFEAAPCDAQLAVNRTDDPWQGAAVYVAEDWRVTRLVEKPPPGSSTTQWNNAGILVLTRLVFDYARALAPSPRGELELPEAIGRMVAGGRHVRAVPIRGAWFDVGAPADLEAAGRHFHGPASLA
jgi:NDP-sugar pyrophosphorylase family protein